MELDQVGWRRSRKLYTDNLDQGSKTLETCKNIDGYLKPQGTGTEHINENQKAIEQEKTFRPVLSIQESCDPESGRDLLRATQLHEAPSTHPQQALHPHARTGSLELRLGWMERACWGDHVFTDWLPLVARQLKYRPPGE
ncbi:hypothetical protein G4228_019232 [Cervus hanglu yarkandensis]|nr:hypothetical protein G4228_019232 [Cervus hanglu yarkandensis]